MEYTNFRLDDQVALVTVDSMGIGFGFQDGDMRMLEIEYTTIDDNRYSPEIRMLSIGYYF